MMYSLYCPVEGSTHADGSPRPRPGVYAITQAESRKQAETLIKNRLDDANEMRTALDVGPNISGHAGVYGFHPASIVELDDACLLVKTEMFGWIPF